MAFDVVVAKTKEHPPKGDPSAAYRDIYDTLVTRHGFASKPGSVHPLPDENMARLFAAIMDLKALPWLPAGVRDIRAFRVEQGSDFTPLVKDPERRPGTPVGRSRAARRWLGCAVGQPT